MEFRHPTVFCFLVVLCALAESLQFHYNSSPDEQIDISFGSSVEMVCISNDSTLLIIHRNLIGVTVAQTRFPSKQLKHIIHQASCSDSDIYECRDGYDIREHLELYVVCPLKFYGEYPEKKFYGTVWASISIIFRLKGYPGPVNVSFLPINGGPETKYSSEYLKTYFPLYLRFFKLSIHRLEHRDFKDYGIIFSSRLGSLSHEFSLININSKDSSNSDNSQDSDNSVDALWIIVGTCAFINVVSIITCICLARRAEKRSGQSMGSNPRTANMACTVSSGVPHLHEVGVAHNTPVSNRVNSSESRSISSVEPLLQHLSPLDLDLPPPYEAVISMSDSPYQG